MTTALLTHPACLSHITPTGHPEQVARLERVLAALDPLTLQRQAAPMAAEDDLLRLHPQHHLDGLREAQPTTGQRALDGDTFLSPGSLEAAYRGAGAALKAVDMVLSGEVHNAFCAIRPPGHHAESETAMGFCLLGNAALAAKYALDHHGLARVAVVDFDVHHGNGTQELLYDEHRALVVTSQQMPLWPGSGAVEETGLYDTVLNIPLAPGSDGVAMRRAYEAQVFPRLEAFRPDLIIVSAGFDAHQADPLADLNWSTDDFRWLSARLCALAAQLCAGRLISTLEGGYDLDALAAACAAHVQALIEGAPAT